MTTMINEWREWVVENLEYGVSKKKIFDILVSKGFSYNDILSLIDHIPPNPSEVPYNPSAEEPVVFESKIIEQQNTNNITINDRQIDGTKVLFDNNIAEMYYVDDFLSIDECKNIQSIIDNTKYTSHKKLTRINADITTSANHQSIEYKKQLNIIDEKIDNILGIHSSRGEPIQLSRYSKNNKSCGLSHDGYEPDETTLKNIGNRTWSAVVFLNDDYEGGNIMFNNILAPDTPFGLTPKMGRLIIWNNIRNDGLLNEYCEYTEIPVMSDGKSKYILTKSYRRKDSAELHQLKKTLIKKPVTAKKTTTKKPTQKKRVAKKPTQKKRVAKKPTQKKRVAKKTATKSTPRVLKSSTDDTT